MPDEPTQQTPSAPSDPVRVFIGYDHRQPVAFTVLSRSIVARCKRRVQIEPVMAQTVPIKRFGLTPFTWTRFLVPWLCNYEGWSLFLDADQQVLGDIGELWDLRDDRYAIQVVKNADPRMRFEWASVMLFNNARCRMLTPEYVQTTNDPIHKIKFVSETEIGDLPSEWNHLVGYDKPRPDAKLVHFTQGIPIWPETRDSEYSQGYNQEGMGAMSAESWVSLMGNSVHAGPVYERLARQHAAAKAQTADLAAANKERVA